MRGYSRDKTTVLCFMNYPDVEQKNTGLRTCMNSNLYLRLWSWKFNDIASKCGLSVSESIVGRASSGVLRVDTMRGMPKPMENYRGANAANISR